MRFLYVVLLLVAVLTKLSVAPGSESDGSWASRRPAYKLKEPPPDAVRDPTLIISLLNTIHFFPAAQVEPWTDGSWSVLRPAYPLPEYQKKSSKIAHPLPTLEEGQEFLRRQQY
ncbi:uncharacterized protein LOC126834119 isoform X3 [Adelges cooleyi]|uniref:uncharacterized protein LOC126834119 isoform X3 n=1 Tax=Adelges cooleyi TaxID=133065 RepID=UPI0021809AA5|nr:uncharacterized protein LOC126834119 isoform X3 [Adelges cooleyi]